MTAIDYDLWIERLIDAGHLSPGARGLSRREAAAQFNAANALTAEDSDFIYSPGQAQVAAREALGLVGIDIADGVRVLLTDGDAGLHCGHAYLTNVGQIEAAVEQHRLTTGEALAIEPLISALPWA